MVHNKIYFGGYLGRDAESFTTPGGTRIVSFSLCATKKGKNGAQDTQTWTRVKCFGNWCDYAAKFKKGDNVMVDGELQVVSFKNKEGVEKTSVDIVAQGLALIQKPEQHAQPTQNAQPVGATGGDDYIPF